VFESGAILLYLAEKTSKFIPWQLCFKTVNEWLFWQMGGPMAGQKSITLGQYAPEKISTQLTARETKNRLYSVSTGGSKNT